MLNEGVSVQPSVKPKYYFVNVVYKLYYRISKFTSVDTLQTKISPDFNRLRDRTKQSKLFVTRRFAITLKKARKTPAA